jgi:hypothetical protein
VSLFLLLALYHCRKFSRCFICSFVDLVPSWRYFTLVSSTWFSSGVVSLVSLTWFPCGAVVVSASAAEIWSVLSMNQPAQYPTTATVPSLRCYLPTPHPQEVLRPQGNEYEMLATQITNEAVLKAAFHRHQGLLPDRMPHPHPY